MGDALAPNASQRRKTTVSTSEHKNNEEEEELFLQTNMTTSIAAKIQTVDPQSRSIARSPSFQTKTKRRQSVGGRRVSFAQPKELEKVREFYKVRRN